jgi:sulfatase modifying factor 1
MEGGNFMMGCEEEKGSPCQNNELPQYQVTVSNYYIGKNEVTFDEYDKFCDDTGAKKPSAEGFGRGLRPVIHVSWEDATAYCKWLSKKTGKNYRLPTETEWEYATRRGNKSKGYKYIGSNNINEVAWYKHNSGGRTSIIKANQANELGIYDMSKNVYEWCKDWYKVYLGSDDVANKTGSNRVFRGGSFSFSVMFIKVYYRECTSPTDLSDDIGFRLVHD